MDDYDEILEQEAREQLEDQGYDELSIEIILGDMKDSGMFDYPKEY